MIFFSLYVSCPLNWAKGEVEEQEERQLSSDKHSARELAGGGALGNLVDHQLPYFSCREDITPLAKLDNLPATLVTPCLTPSLMSDRSVPE